MFNGIVEAIGTITTVTTDKDCVHIAITSTADFADLKIGDSLAVNGVCLTITAIHPQTWHVTLVPETLRLTNLSQLTVGTPVNLERSIKMGDRISGHFVQGHVDATGEIIDITLDGEDALLIKIRIPPELSPYLINKGYIAVDGMSLTIIAANTHWFTLTLIPHTKTVTIAKNYCVGSKVNLEVDMLSKYLEKMTRTHHVHSTS